MPHTHTQTVSLEKPSRHIHHDILDSGCSQEARPVLRRTFVAERQERLGPSPPACLGEHSRQVSGDRPAEPVIPGLQHSACGGQVAMGGASRCSQPNPWQPAAGRQGPVRQRWALAFKSCTQPRRPLPTLLSHVRLDGCTQCPVCAGPHFRSRPLHERQGAPKQPQTRQPWPHKRVPAGNEFQSA